MEADKLPKIDELKLIHDIYAVTHQILTQKCTFHHEEFDFVKTTIEFYKQQLASVREQIEKLEEVEKQAIEEVKDGENKSQD